MAKCESYPLQRLPLWGSWREAPERARLLTVTQPHSDSITLTKSCLSLREQPYPHGLALSVTSGDTSPKGRGFGYSVRPLLFAQGSPSGRAGAKRLRGQGC